MTYRPNEIIPFPINEDCISNFVVAIIMPTSMTHFYQYLSNLEDFDEALIIFGLHADIRIYMRMYDEREFFNRDQIHSKAVQIFEDYIIEDCKWALRLPMNLDKNSAGSSLHSKQDQDLNPIPMEILQEIRDGYTQGRVRFILNNGLFSDLYVYTLERLR